jgi:hypothetical protein
LQQSSTHVNPVPVVILTTLLHEIIIIIVYIYF